MPHLEQIPQRTFSERAGFVPSLNPTSDILLDQLGSDFG
jgi:hypothetical protein